MEEFLPLSIGVGLFVSLILAELFGIAAGGMIVPGYIALHITRPVDILLTLVAAFATYLVVHTASAFVLIFGRRRTVLMILVGFQMGILVSWVAPQLSFVHGIEGRAVGYIIPGLIAIWLDRQGVVETLSAMTVASVLVRMTLILLGLELGT
ncbi:MAG: poly-gamma-glutamate biosynthesis protein PgsC [Myxococcales bacterium]|nr:poly-gamma-glutamate biosynthesis protein PgsC [Myxococcales bacterium]